MHSGVSKAKSRLKCSQFLWFHLKFAIRPMEASELIPLLNLFDVYRPDQLSLASAFGPVNLQLGPIGQAKARNGL